MILIRFNVVWFKQAILILFAALMIMYNLIPFNLTPDALPTGDIMFCVICILTIRRPEIVPFWIITLIYLGFDIFQMKALGVKTICVLIAAEILRLYRNIFRENPFFFEWLVISVAFLLVLIANEVILRLTIVPTPPISNLFWEFLFTILVYPIILFLMTYVLKIKKPAMGEFDNRGQKL